jgi:hypothetical protein
MVTDDYDGVTCWDDEALKEDETMNREPSKKRPFGWEVDVEFHPASKLPPATFHWRGCSERTARMRAALKRHMIRIVDVRHVNKDEWIRAYGIGRM